MKKMKKKKLEVNGQKPERDYELIQNVEGCWREGYDPIKSDSCE